MPVNRGVVRRVAGDASGDAVSVKAEVLLRMLPAVAAPRFTQEFAVLENCWTGAKPKSKTYIFNAPSRNEYLKNVVGRNGDMVGWVPGGAEKANLPRLLRLA